MPRSQCSLILCVKCLFLSRQYIKLGQFIASSPTLFPAAYVEEFQKCLDSVEPVPFAEIERIIASELQTKGLSTQSVFSSIDPIPLATASIAQVHHLGSPIVLPACLGFARGVFLTRMGRCTRQSCAARARTSSSRLADPPTGRAHPPSPSDQGPLLAVAARRAQGGWPAAGEEAGGVGRAADGPVLPLPRVARARVPQPRPEAALPRRRDPGHPRLDDGGGARSPPTRVAPCQRVGVGGGAATGLPRQRLGCQGGRGA